MQNNKWEEKDRLSKLLDHYVGTTMSKSKGYVIKKVVKDIIAQRDEELRGKIIENAKLVIGADNKKVNSYFKISYNDLLTLISPNQEIGGEK